MSYKSYVTNVGAGKIATAMATGTAVNITKIAIGDGGGSAITPAPDMSALVHEVARIDITATERAEAAKTLTAIAEIAADVGGWTIRELGLYDSAGDLIAVCNYPDTIKPVLTDGVASSVTVGMAIIVSSLAAVTITVSASADLRPYESDTANIKMDGTAAVGSRNTVVRGDHVHPTDTSRLAVAPTTLTSAINLDTLKTTGFYMNPTSTNATSNNYPEISAGYLSVVGNGMSAEQTYAVYNSTKKWRRFCINDGTWTAWAVIWDANSDGTGSGLDADLLDGLNSADFTRRWYVGSNSSTARWFKLCTIAVGTVQGSRITFLLNGGIRGYGDDRGNGHAILDLTLLNTNLWAATLYQTIVLSAAAINGVKIVQSGDTGAEVWLNMGTYANVSALMLGNNHEAKVTPATTVFTTTAPEGSDGYIYDIWHSGNDGAGSGLDADLLDGIESARMIYGDTINGSIAVTDVNAVVKSGFYHCDSAAANIPVVLGGSLLHQQHATVDTYASQIFIVYSTGVVYRRTNVSGTWSAWQIMYTSGNFPFEATASNIKMDGTQSVGSLATAARGDHVHPSDALKANIASPAFTGTPTAPTAAVTDNSTRVATTGWVRAAMATIMSALGFVISLGSSGYIKFPSCLGGLLIQWGYIAGVANTEISGTFPLAFPTACLRVIGSAEYANISAVNGNAVSIAFTSASGFHAICSEDSTQINYVAIGY